MFQTDTCAPPSGGGGMTVGASPATQAAPIGTSHPTSVIGINESDLLIWYKAQMGSIDQKANNTETDITVGLFV